MVLGDGIMPIRQGNVTDTDTDNFITRVPSK